MADEAYVQVAPDSSGKKVRNLQVTTVDSTGTQNTVEMQVVAIADPNGQPLDLSLPEVVDFLHYICTELRMQTQILAEAFGLKNLDPAHMRNDSYYTDDDDPTI